MDADTDVLDVLGDEHARRILTAGLAQPVTVEELAEDCDVSPSTIYRRLRKLEELGLIRSETDIRSNSDNQNVYTTEIDHLEIDVTPHGFHLDRTTDEVDEDGVIDILQDIEFEHADVDFRNGIIDLRMQFDSQRLDQFVELWDQIEGGPGPGDGADANGSE